MRPVQELHNLETTDLLAELGEITARLVVQIEQQFKADLEYQRVNLNRYFASMGDSHAAKQREADYHSLTEKDDYLTFTEQVTSLTVIRDYITNLIEWRNRV